MSKSIISSTASTITPTRAFFRVNQELSTLAQSRQVFKALGEYGDLVEYKVLRCPETFKMLRYGFVVFKHQQDAKKAFNDQFIKITLDQFDQPCEIKVEAPTKRTS
ncbi:uncharacterized protein BX664DRAFT_337528 [Halteromyces radiatus]|uniref:uncharacterized protein n=1 Tax=Halteromyces radiatus TaxID=101107 RepID=UPI00221EBC56|nr:uncharacterized protein BX664DRAFT_337528 [Halteromyces radiatus]KAI8084670.1 hypothetical protein BX664DRAFT_337528 [Halteromyces radiatus]